MNINTDFNMEQLKPLADKLGQTVEVVYSIYLRQIYINAVFGCVVMVLSSFLAFYFSIVASKIQEDDLFYAEKRFGYVALCMFLGVVAAFSGTDAIQSLLNPNYQVLQMVLSAIK